MNTPYNYIQNSDHDERTLLGQGCMAAITELIEICRGRVPGGARTGPIGFLCRAANRAQEGKS